MRRVLCPTLFVLPTIPRGRRATTLDPHMNEGNPHIWRYTQHRTLQKRACDYKGHFHKNIVNELINNGTDVNVKYIVSCILNNNIVFDNRFDVWYATGGNDSAYLGM